MKISSVGEFGLINQATKNLTYNDNGLIMGIGDDAAVLKTSQGKWTLVTTDMLVEDVHFSLAWATLEQVGWKAVVVNVSDIAAMGGKPTHGTVSIGIPEETLVEDIEALYNGIRRAAKFYKINIVGGDTVKCPVKLVLNVTLMGEVDEGKAIFRSGANPGDLIFVTGPLGGSAAGLHLLTHQLSCSTEERQQLAEFHLEPKARTEQGRLLGISGMGTSMNDISDGLASELKEICVASNTGFSIDYQDIPLAGVAKKIAAKNGIDPVNWALYGGEDFELVFTAAASNVNKLQVLFKNHGFHLFKIGRITHPDKGCWLRGSPQGDVELTAQGYNHFTD